MQRVIDTHVHIGGGKYASPAEWRASADRHGVAAVVLSQNLGNTDNRELLEARRGDPERIAAIVIPESAEAIPDLFEAGAMGVRLSPRGLHHEPGTDAFAALDQLGGLASVTGPFEELATDEFADLVDRHPFITFRLEHLGAFPYGERAPEEFRSLLRLAERENTVLLWSGYFHYSRTGWPYRDAWPILEQSLEAFGPERITWSGDWNRAGGTAEDYGSDIALIGKLPFLGSREIEAILSANARRIFEFGAA